MENNMPILEETTHETGVTVIMQNEISLASPNYEVGLGNENVTMKDINTPMLLIADQMSDCQKPNSPSYIKGIVTGDIYNTVTKQIYPVSYMRPAEEKVSKLRVMFLNFRIEYSVRKPKAGGIFGRFKTQKEAYDLIKHPSLDSHTDLFVSDDAIHYALVIEENKVPQPVLIPMSKSRLKSSREINSLVLFHGGDRFSGLYELSTCSIKLQSSNNEVNIYKTKRIGLADPQDYLYAKQIYKMDDIAADNSEE